MELAHLDTFTLLVQKGSFSRVAKELGISQPTVTVRIRALEEELGMTLIVRVGNRISLTPAGRVFYDSTKRALRVLRDGLDLQVGSEAKPLVHLAIGSSPTMSTYYLPSLLGRFHRIRPDWEISVHTGYSREVIELVMDEVVHMGFIRGTYHHPDVNSIPAYKDRLCLVAHPEHSLAGRPKATSYDIRNEPILTYPSESNLYFMIQNFFRENGVKPNIAMELTHVVTIKRMVMEGNGIAFLPWITVKKEIEERRLVEVDLCPSRPIFRNNSLIFLRRRKGDGQIREFLLFWQDTVKANSK